MLEISLSQKAPWKTCLDAFVSNTLGISHSKQPDNRDLLLHWRCAFGAVCIAIIKTLSTRENMDINKYSFNKWLRFWLAKWKHSQMHEHIF